MVFDMGVLQEKALPLVATVKVYQIRTYNPNKGCKDLTQRRKGIEKVRKEKHFKKRE
jgi:hypothetical protein